MIYSSFYNSYDFASTEPKTSFLSQTQKRLSLNLFSEAMTNIENTHFNVSFLLDEDRSTSFSIFKAINIPKDISFSETAITNDTKQAVFDQFSLSLRVLFSEYASGEIDISDIVIKLGNHWTPEDIIRMLEAFNIQRDILSESISEEDEKFILQELAHINSSSQAGILNDENWIRRQTTSLQRISAVFVSPSDFNE